MHQQEKKKTKISCLVQNKNRALFSGKGVTASAALNDPVK